MPYKLSSSKELLPDGERSEEILQQKRKHLYYFAFILPYFNYGNQVWHHCRKRNTAKIEKVNERALRYVFKK